MLFAAATRPLPMAKSKRKRAPNFSVLSYQILNNSKSAVLNSLRTSTSSKAFGAVDHAIVELTTNWYCSEPRLALNRSVHPVRIALEQHPYAPSTINLNWRRYAGCLY